MAINQLRAMQRRQSARRELEVSELREVLKMDTGEAPTTLEEVAARVARVERIVVGVIDSMKARVGKPAEDAREAEVAAKEIRP